MMRAAFGLRGLAPAIVAAAVLAAAGAVLVAASRHERALADRELSSARSERVHARERLARAAQDERELTERIGLYRRLASLNILGAERRVEWTESLARIRERRRLSKLNYQIAPRRTLQSLPVASGRVETFASRMKLELDLLHEGDLLGLLADLRAHGNAYHAVQQCSIARSAPAASAGPLAPRLRAVCEIELITLQHGGAPA